MNISNFGSRCLGALLAERRLLLHWKSLACNCDMTTVGNERHINYYFESGRINGLHIILKALKNARQTSGA